MDDEAIRDHEADEAQAQSDRERYEEIQFDESKEHEPEPSEEEVALVGLDREHVEDYLAIKRAVSGTDLSERWVDVAVKTGLRNR